MESFTIERTTGFSREFRKLMKRHREFFEVYEKAILALAVDPYNISRTYDILKLANVYKGDGQYRIRLRRWRFRYDIVANSVVLKYCSLRREDTYHV